MTAHRGMRISGRRGSAIVEFALVASLLITVMLACFEFGRMFLAYTSLANAARTGLRYAIVHGNTGTDVSGPGANPPAVVAAVKDMAVLGLLDPTKVERGVSVDYPDAKNKPGSRVKVTVVYTYDPWFALPLSVDLKSISEGVIVY